MASINRDEISRLELLHAAHPDGLVFPHLADAYRRAGRFAQAESVLTAGLRNHAEYSSAHVVLGRLRLDQGQRAAAETAFRRVLQLDPHNHVALDYLGRLATEDGRLEEALNHYRKLARVKPGETVAERVIDLERRLQGRGAPGPSGSPPGASGDAHRSAVSGDAAGNGGGAPPSEGWRRTEAGAPTRRPNGSPPGLPETPPPRAGPVEPGEVVTETMAELYARQGLDDRAAAVYHKLLERNPGDVRLRKKLEALAARRPDAAPAGAQTPPTPEPAGSTGVAPSRDRPDAGPAGLDARPDIRDHLRGVLGWRPGGTTQAPPGAPGTEEASRPPGDAVARAEPVEPPTSTEPPAPTSTPEPAPAEPPTSRPTPAPAPSPQDEDFALPGLDPGQAAGSPWALGGPGRVLTGLEEASPQARSLLALTDLLVGLLEYRDPFFRGSSSLTRLLATQVAKEMGLPLEQQVDVALAAILRDLGRLAMGGRLVPTQRGPQSPEARRKIERHVDLALHLLEGIDLSPAVRLAVRHHHERWDGAGYPDALAGRDVPLLARILAVADSFGAMVSPRPYRLPRKVPEAIRELQEEAGAQYDPDVVDALVRVVGRSAQPNLGFVQRHHILLLSPDQPGAVVTATKLCSAGYLAEVSVDPPSARERLRRVPVAALVVSADLGPEHVAELLRDLRVDPMFSNLPLAVVDADDPALRVRLLDSGADVCFGRGISYAELQSTLGALIRRSMRSGPASGTPTGTGEAPWLALQGDIQDFPMTWLLQVMKYDSRTAGIGIRTARDDGAIYLRGGDAVHAEIRGGPKGEEALRQMLQWRKGRFTVQPDARPSERTIQTSIMHLLLSQAVDQDHVSAGIFGAVSES
jgi:tetratricopeptide (TPR) repeat protein